MPRHLRLSFNHRLSQLRPLAARLLQSSRRLQRQRRRPPQDLALLVLPAVPIQAACLPVLAVLARATILSQAQAQAWAAHPVLETILSLQVTAKVVVEVPVLLVLGQTLERCPLVHEVH